MSDDVETATRYLRGELDELDRTVFEERLLADAAVHTAVLAAEDELLDAHAAGQLDGPVRDRLRQRLAAEPELRRRLALARGLFQRAARADAGPAAPGATPRRPARSRVLRWMVPLAVAALAAVIALIVLSGEPRHRPEVVTLAMAAPTRSSVVPELTLAAGTRTVRLVLDVPAAPPPTVRLTGPRGELGVVQVPGSPDGVTIEVAAAALVPGLHDITVSADGAPVVVFQLRVSRR